MLEFWELKSTPLRMVKVMKHHCRPVRKPLPPLPHITIKFVILNGKAISGHLARIIGTAIHLCKRLNINNEMPCPLTAINQTLVLVYCNIAQSKYTEGEMKRIYTLGIDEVSSATVLFSKALVQDLLFKCTVSTKVINTLQVLSSKSLRF